MTCLYLWYMLSLKTIWHFLRLLPVRVDMVADLLQQTEGSAQGGAEHVHRHQAAVPRRHGCLHQHLLDVGDRRTLILWHQHRQHVSLRTFLEYVRARVLECVSRLPSQAALQGLPEHHGKGRCSREPLWWTPRDLSRAGGAAVAGSWWRRRQESRRSHGARHLFPYQVEVACSIYHNISDVLPDKILEQWVLAPLVYH